MAFSLYVHTNLLLLNIFDVTVAALKWLLIIWLVLMNAVYWPVATRIRSSYVKK